MIFMGNYVEIVEVRKMVSKDMFTLMRINMNMHFLLVVYHLEGAEPEDDALDLPVGLCCKPHLWSCTLGIIYDCVYKQPNEVSLAGLSHRQREGEELRYAEESQSRT